MYLYNITGMNPEASQITERIEQLQKPRGRPRLFADLPEEERIQALKERHRKANRSYFRSLPDEVKRQKWRESKRVTNERRKLRRELEEAQAAAQAQAPAASDENI